MAGSFGEKRLLRSLPERWLYRLLGTPDPADFLHFTYLRRALDRWADFAPLRILDAGCGAGDFPIYLARRYPQAEVIGIDYDPSMIQVAATSARALEIPNVEFRLQDLASATLPADLDFVCAIDVLEHIPAQRAILSRLLASLRAGGRAFYHIPVVRPRPVPFSRRLQAFHAWAEREHVAEPLTSAAFETRLIEVGYRVERMTPSFGYFTGELAISLFNLPYDRRPRNQVFQALLALPCRLLAGLDLLDLDRPRYGVAAEASRPRNCLSLTTAPTLGTEQASASTA